MPRSEHSLDIGHGSIASERFEHSEDEQAVGPSSPVSPKKRAPWNIQTTTDANAVPKPSSPPPTRRGTVRTSPRSPSVWQEALEVPQPMPQGKSSFRLTGPNARFRAAVLKVIQVNRLRFLSDEEPGVDIRSDTNAALYGHIRAQCSIEVIDYGAVKYHSTRLKNSELENYIAPETHSRPLWSKVRWINIGGVSWDVVKCLALRYNIHPLSIEDMLHNHQTYSSKADYYSKHMFLRILCHTLVDKNHPQPHPVPYGGGSPPPTYSSTDPLTAPPNENIKFQRTNTPAHYDAAPYDPSSEKADKPTNKGLTVPGTEDEKAHRPALKSLASVALFGAQPWVDKHVGGEGIDPERSWAHSVYPNITGKKRRTRAKYSQHMASLFLTPPSGTRQTTEQVVVNELKKGDRIQVNLRNLFVVMLRDGTLITIHQDPGNDFFKPILSRLKQRDTLLRNSSDVSMLLHGILDLVVDNTVQVVEKYQQRLLEHEGDILTNPKISTVRSLHIASGDIAMHKRTLTPIKTLIYGLRRYDLDRCIATANSRTPGFDEKKIEGFLSHKSKIYLADVMDHMDYVIDSLEMFGSMAENLITYTFNTVSYEMNTTVRTLTIMTVIFFPPTFFTGYCGMNFNIFGVKRRGELFFWELILPVMVPIMIFAFWGHIVRMVHYLKKRRVQDRIRAMMTL